MTDSDSGRFSMEMLLGHAQTERASCHEFRMNRWEAVSWSVLLRDVKRVAAALLRRGIARGSRVCLLGSGLRWTEAYLGAQLAGCVPVGIYDTSPMEDICFTVGDCGAQMMFANRSSLRAPDAISVPVVFFDDESEASSWEVFLESASVDEDAIRTSAALQRSEDMAAIIYTSGTTGQSKGVVLSFRNIDAFLKARVCAIHGSDTRALSFLPLSHLAGQAWTIWVLVAFGGQVWFSRGLPFLVNDLRESRPTTFFAPPRVYEGWFREFSHRPDKDAVKRELGLEQCEDMICAAAPFDEKTLSWFHSVGLFVREVYGLSEVPVATSSSRIAYKVGSVGKAEVGTEVVITATEDEVLVRGDVVFSHYWNKETETQDAFTPDGWLRTGDMGRLDADGYLFITGRKKDLIALDGGKKVMPAKIESMLKENALISDAVVFGERRPYLVALLSLQIDSPDASRRVAEWIADVNSRLATVEQIRRFELIPKLATTPSALTATMKLRRASVYETYKGLIASMYPSLSEQAEEDEKCVANVISTLRDMMRTYALVDSKGKDDDTPFFQLGMSSFAVAEAARRISTAFKIELSPVAAMEFPTITRLASRVNVLVTGRLMDDSAMQGYSLSMGSAGSGARAIVRGTSCRVASCWAPTDLWELFAGGIDCISAIPPGRWTWSLVPETPRGPVCRWGSFFVGMDLFDAAFFQISPREALHLDPQHRLLLETSWEALETTPLDPTALRERGMGVYVGISTGDYVRRHTEVFFDGGTSVIASTAAGRVAYVLGVTGTTLSVDTACSSSLVSFILAVDAVKTGRDQGAVCCGVHALCSPHLFISCTGAGMLSPDGRCKTFDASANGFVRGEGCVALFIQTDAESHHGEVSGKIRGCAVNQDGRSNGLTAPNGQSQAKMLVKAAAEAMAAPSNVGMLEAHGTGTALGDPIEMFAVGNALGKRTTPLVMGSSKTNIGHTETASGAFGLLKVLLCLKRQLSPRMLHLTNLNDYIGEGLMCSLKCVVPLETLDICFSSDPLAGVSSFGLSGTNSHVVVECQNHAKSSRGACVSSPSGLFVLTISAKTSVGLKQAQQIFSMYLAESTNPIADMCANVERKHVFDEKICVHGVSAKEIAAAVIAGATTESGGSNIVQQAAEDFVATPSYSFSRKSFWIESTWPFETIESVCGVQVHASADVTIFEAQKDVVMRWYTIADHVVMGAEVIPGAAFLAVAVEQRKEISEAGEAIVLRRVEMRQVAVVESNLMLQFVHRNNGFEVRSVIDGER